MFKKILWLIFVTCNLFAADASSSVKLEDSIKIEALRQRTTAIDEAIQDNLWFKRYGNYLSYQKLIEELSTVDAEVKKIKNAKDKVTIEKRERLVSKQESLEKQIELLQEFKNSPFSRMVESVELESYPRITNPFAIISALSYIKKIKQDSMDYRARIDRLDFLVGKLKEKLSLIEEIYQIEPIITNEDMVYEAQKELNAFIAAQEIASTSYSLHVKKVEEATIRVTQDITLQMKRAFNIGIFIVVVIVFTLLLKFVAKRYIKDNDRFYTANKIINFVNVTLIILILLFSYIENVSYLVTVLGFASAGIAIAMKDWFMSILGWMVIIFGGSFHVGDRIKVQKDGLLYVGDIIDISLLRMTLFEDVTISTYRDNRRAGRVIFVPNNYVFTSLISNYTHGTIRTVWDGIDIFITFDSNHKKAVYLAREITKKYAKGYTDIARKQLNLLRNQYSLKNTNVEPRVFSFVEPQGFCISSWYMTNSYATLTLRSTISSEIIDAFNQEDDITIAYHTQNINLGSQKKRMPNLETPKSFDEKSLF
ncbi:mechanosensitive ion channel domain-containing protein [Sulfurospirillum arsenophilum]|uniref:mechanosensitive ion channel domain-containing protein n=1 Tax=Sulfurospirillum arsenophilum TaxID=56698 RepID=UPI0005A609DF|nr:mechanosensitive ion channel domain-containing protein [Sulfurospirillum arsenophilum]